MTAAHVGAHVSEDPSVEVLMLRWAVSVDVWLSLSHAGLNSGTCRGELRAGKPIVYFYEGKGVIVTGSLCSCTVHVYVTRMLGKESSLKSHFSLIYSINKLGSFM